MNTIEDIEIFDIKGGRVTGGDNFENISATPHALESKNMYKICSKLI